MNGYTVLYAHKMQDVATLMKYAIDFTLCEYAERYNPHAHFDGSVSTTFTPSILANYGMAMAYSARYTYSIINEQFVP